MWFAKRRSWAIPHLWLNTDAFYAKHRNYRLPRIDNSNCSWFFFPLSTGQDAGCNRNPSDTRPFAESEFRGATELIWRHISEFDRLVIAQSPVPGSWTASSQHRRQEGGGEIFRFTTLHLRTGRLEMRVTSRLCSVWRGKRGGSFFGLRTQKVAAGRGAKHGAARHWHRDPLKKDNNCEDI